jgi:hypothetical protein
MGKSEQHLPQAMPFSSLHQAQRFARQFQGKENELHLNPQRELTAKGAKLRQIKPNHFEDQPSPIFCILGG